MPKPPAEPSDLELQVLSLLWSDGPLTARQVRQKLPDGKARAYTTVLTVLQVMEKKSLVRHTRDAAGRSLAHVYQATVTQRRVLGPLLRGLVAKVFGGSTSTAVQHLLNETDVHPDELQKIRALLKDYDASSDGRKRNA